MADLDDPPVFNWKVSHVPGVANAVHRQGHEVEAKAEGNLRAVDAAMKSGGRITPEGYFPASIDGEEEDIDYVVALEAPNAMALEYGHFPSGWFDPDRYGKVTKAPDGTYILTSAAGWPVKFTSPSGRRR